MKTQVIVAAAGTGERLGMDVAKPFVLLNGKPLVSYALSIFEACDSIDSVIIAAEVNALEMMREVVDQAGLTKVRHIVAGGELRSDSVKNALAVVDEDTDRVVIHDGARPLITVDFIDQMIAAVVDEDALVAAIPVKPTIKHVNSKTLIVEKTLDRSCLWDVQTPQIFKKDVLFEAYETDDLRATDDAALVERLGKNVKIFQGLEQNIKVTTKNDLFLAEKLLELGI